MCLTNFKYFYKGNESITDTVKVGSLEGVADEVTANARIEPEGAERRLVEVLKWAALRLAAEGWLLKRASDMRR